jgi:hypothetical protein
MIPHFALLMITVLIAAFGQQRSASKWQRRTAWVVVSLLLILFAGLRASTVGVDTAGYVGRFEFLRNIGLYWDSLSSGELGIKIIYAVSLMIGSDPHIFLMLASTLAVVLYVCSIRTTAVLPALGLFVFIAFGFYLFHFNGLRQGLALGFFMLAIRHVVTGNLWRYLMWGVIAGLFHTTAFFALPVYLLARKGVTPFNIFILIIGSTVLAFLVGPILMLLGGINERYAAYADRTETGGILLTIFYIGISILFLVMRRGVDVRLRRAYDRFLMLTLAGTTIFATITLTESYIELTRMALYLTVSITFLVPILITSAKSTGQRGLIYTVILCSGCIFYYFFLSQIGGYIPYKLWT